MSARRRVLLVTYHALPAVTPGSLRARWMAAELSAREWVVTLVTARADAAPIDGVRVVTAGPGSSYLDRLPRRLRTLWNDYAVPDRHVTWSHALQRRLEALLVSDGADAVLCTSPPHSSHLAVSRLRHRHRFVYVADFRDPWTAPARQHRPRWSAGMQRRMEADVLGAADGVIANTRGNREALLRTFPDISAAKVEVIPNAFEDEMSRAPREPASETADITYVGEVYPGMTQRFVTALRSTRDRTAEPPRLAIYGHVDPRERARIAAAGLEDLVEYRGWVSHAESLEAMRRARSLLLLLPEGEHWATCVPSKLYPYLASGRPVLALVPQGDVAAILRETGAGEALTAAGEPDAAGLSAFVARVRAGAAGGERREDVIARYSVSAAGARLDAMLRRLLERVP